MKKIYTLLLMVALILPSCNGFLDKAPSTSAPIDEAILNMNDLNNAVNGVYYLVSEDRMTYTSDFCVYADVKGEDFMPKSNVNQVGFISRYQVGKYDMESSMAYEMFYKAIANINRILSVIDQVPHDESEKGMAEFNDLKGQLYAFRALLHFDLARYFCQLPTVSTDLNAENSGLVISTENHPIEFIGTRSTLKQTYDQIIEDFTTALPLLTKKSHNGYINYWAAVALRSRAYLYYGKYAESLADAKEVIEKSNYKLYPIKDYVEAWLNEFTSESIFEIKTTATYNAQRNSMGYYCDADGYGEVAFAEKAPLYQYLSTHPEDIRSQLIKDQTDEKYNYPGLYPAKYNGRNGNLYVNNPKIIRLSEVYLIAAEAALKSNDGNAAFYVNELRKNRIEGYSDVQDVTIDDILNERRYELFAENHLSFDMWRNKKSVNNPNVGIVDYTDHRTILPIPQTEIDVTKGKLVQNPEY